MFKNSAVYYVTFKCYVQLHLYFFSLDQGLQLHMPQVGFCKLSLWILYSFNEISSHNKNGI